MTCKKVLAIIAGITLIVTSCPAMDNTAKVTFQNIGATLTPKGNYTSNLLSTTAQKVCNVPGAMAGVGITTLVWMLTHSANDPMITGAVSVLSAASCVPAIWAPIQKKLVTNSAKAKLLQLVDELLANPTMEPRRTLIIGYGADLGKGIQAMLDEYFTHREKRLKLQKALAKAKKSPEILEIEITEAKELEIQSLQDIKTRLVAL